MHFFIDYSALTDQSDENAFGPDSVDPSNIYNLTSKFDLNTDAKAFACQTGMLIVQQSSEDDTLVNVIIKPTSTLFSSSIKVAYYIYRGFNRWSNH